MEQKQFYTIGLFSIVAVIGMVLLVMGTGVTETGMFPCIGGECSLGKAIKRVPPPTYEMPGFGTGRIQYNLCVSKCAQDFNRCIDNVEQKWQNCMSVTDTTICEPPRERGKLYCDKDRSGCESYCTRRYL